MLHINGHNYQSHFLNILLNILIRILRNKNEKYLWKWEIYLTDSFFTLMTTIKLIVMLFWHIHNILLYLNKLEK